jgi:hypothetical protein
VQGKK